MDAPISPTGISFVSQPQTAVVDIIFVHGLQGHPQKTWSAPMPAEGQSQPSASATNFRRRDKFLRFLQHSSKRESLPSGSDGNNGQTDTAQDVRKDVFWPRDFLKEDFPTARIMTFGYNTNITQGYNATNQGDIFSHAKNLLYQLESKRRPAPDRHLIFIVHSLGGIITKEALRRSEVDPDPKIAKIFNSTRAIFFFGTPHRGSKDWASFGEGITKVAGVLLGIDTNSKILHALLPTAPELDLCQESFLTQWMKHIDRLTVRTFQESRPLTGVRWGNFNNLIVPPDSSSLNHPNQRSITVDADHVGIVKFSGKDDKVYEMVRADIEELVSDAERQLQANPINLSKYLEQVLKKKESLQAKDSVDENLLTNLQEESMEWFMTSTQYSEWVSSEYSTFLWLYGRPNDGKTIIAAWLRKQLSESRANLKKQDVVSIFCSPDINEIGMILSLISQLSPRIHRIDPGRDETTLSQFLTKFKHEEELLSDSWELLEVLIKTPPKREVVFIIDGIDEAEKQSRHQFLRSLQGLAERIKEEIVVRIFVSSRDYPDIRDCLASWPNIERSKEWKECLQSLYFEEWNARGNIIDNALEGGSWLSSSKDYKEWLASSRSDCLWLAGKPGSGKSTLVKFIAKDYTEKSAASKDATSVGHHAHTEENIVSSFHYSFRGGDTESSHELMLRSISYQIFQSNERLFPLIRARFRHLQASKLKWDYENLKSALQSLRTVEFNIKVFLFVDGMDESDSADRDNIIGFLFSLADSSQGCCTFKVLIASRPESYIRPWMNQVRHISLEEMNRKDIQIIVDSRVSELRNLHELALDHHSTKKELEDEEETFTMIKTYIVKNARGVFLWVSLVLSELKRFIKLGGYSLHDVKVCLHSLPTELGKSDGFYTLMVKRLVENTKKPKHFEAWSWRIFAWVTFSERQLAVTELADALAISEQCLTQSPGTAFNLAEWRPFGLINSLYSLCGGFIEVKTSAGRPIVQLMHQTVREFLLGKDQLAKPYDMNQSSGDKEIAMTCCIYIHLAFISKVAQRQVDSTFSLATEVAEHLSDWNLLEYALTHLQSHLESPGIIDKQTLSESKRLVNGILSDSTSYASALLLGWARRQSWLQCTNMPTQTDLEQDCLDCVLIHASGKGWSNVIRVMIDLGANPTRALYTAALNNQLESLSILLQSATKVEAWVEQRETALQAALQAASQAGHAEIVEMLINSGADVNYKDRSGVTALHNAAQAGHATIVEMLINSGADVNHEDHRGITALHNASQAGHTTIVEMLINSGAEVNSRDRSGVIPLHNAAQAGHATIVEMLINSSGDVKHEDHRGITALHNAAQAGHVTIVKMLVDSGAGVNYKDHRGITALHNAARAASEAGHIDIVKLLLETALYAASKNGHIDDVKLLLDRNTDVSAKGGENGNETALCAASNVGHIDIVRLLLDEGAHNGKPNEVGETAVNAASRNGHLEVVRLLLDRGADISEPGEDGWTPLNWASRNGHLKVVRLLLDRGADISEPNEDDWTPLNWASRNGHLKVVRLLLDRGASVDINKAANDGLTPLNNASNKNHREVAQLLRDKGARSYHPEPAHIIYVFNLLHYKKRLPKKLIYAILEQAEYWARITTTLDTSSGKNYTAVGFCREDVLVLRSKPICSAAADGAFDEFSSVREPRDHHPVRRITWTITSHDQGWTSDHGGGLYRGSRTGFQGNVLRYVPSRMSFSRDARPQYSDRTGEAEFGQFSSQEYLSAWNDIQEPDTQIPIKQTEEGDLGQYTDETTDKLRVWPREHDYFETKVQSDRRAVKVPVKRPRQGDLGQYTDKTTDKLRVWPRWHGYFKTKVQSIRRAFKRLRQGDLGKYTDKTTDGRSVWPREHDYFETKVQSDRRAVKVPVKRPRQGDLGQYTDETTDKLRVWPRGHDYFKTKIQSNRRADGKAMEHIIVWDARDCVTADKLARKGRGTETGSGKQVRALCRGDVVELHSYAFCQAWTNHVESARLVIEFAL